MSDGRVAIVTGIPTGPYGHPDEIAQFAAWLLAAAPPCLTGAALPIDGGMTTP